MTKDTPYLFDGPHWQVDAVRDLDVFFANLHALVPSESVICLAGGSWSEERKAFLHTHALDKSHSLRLPDEFEHAPRIPVNIETMLTLADMARRHAEPEIAIHLCVCAGKQSVLEWYDLTDDPISFSRLLPEEKIAQFAVRCGVGFRKV